MVALLLKEAQAGTVESCDIFLILAPAKRGSGIAIDLASPTMQQYGEHIKQLIREMLAVYGVEDALVHANDRGALDYTIRARMKAVIERAIQ